MAVYRITIQPSALRELESIPKLYLKSIVAKIETLRTNPRPHGCEKLSAQERYRVRVGPYRIVYSIEDKALTIWIVKIGHRKEIYRKP